MEKVHDCLTLYSRLETDYFPQEELYKSCCTLENCRLSLITESCYAKNEDVEELTACHLQGLLLDYYIASLCLEIKTTCSLDRIIQLDKASGYYDHFLNWMTKYHMVHEKEREEREEDVHVTPDEFRNRKITRFHQEKKLKQKLKMLQTRTNKDEEDREEWLLVLQLAILKTYDELASLEMEKKMLMEMMQLQSDNGNDNKFIESERQDESLNSRGIEVTHIDATLEMKKERIRSTVFQASHRPPTMSLEEYADRQVDDALERQEREKCAPKGPRRIAQLEEDGEEDNEVLVDEAVYRDRDWDNWKDANPYGSGNKKWQQH